MIRDRSRRRHRHGRAIPLLLSVSLLATAGGSAPAEEAAEWLVLPSQSLVIERGGPLDFSRLTPSAPAGGRGAMTIGQDGTLQFADGSPAGRFHCALLASGPQQSPSFPSHAESDRLAEQLKRHGYTLARIHNLDYLLTRTATTPMAIDAEQHDRFLYLLAALKREGIYWMVDVLTQPAHDLIGRDWSKGGSADDLRVRLHFDPAARTGWSQFLDRTLNVRNPYTGRTTLSDPALAFVVGANENSMAFAARRAKPFPTGLDAAFDRFVRQRFPTPRALGAIGDLDPAERAGNRIALPPDWQANGPRAAIFDLFVASLERDTYRWMRGALTRRGFRGPLLGYHEWYAGATNRTRAALPIIDIHAYVGEVASQRPGAQFSLPSITSPAGMGEMLTHFSSRWLDRPMLASEYGSPFPNRYRYESGLIFPALAAFQGWSTLCRMAFLPVETDIPSPGGDARPMRGYSVGLDPNERAQETLAALLFLRGDVRPATRTVAASFGEEQFRNRGSAFVPGPVKRAALLARFGLIAPEQVATLPPDGVALALGTPANTRIGKAMAILGGADDAAMRRLIERLRANGTLTPDNRTDPAAGIFQSHTGEITVEQPAGTMTVHTPRTEAISSTGPLAATKVGRLEIRHSNGGALIAASSLDGRPLGDSRSILLIVTGDTRNTDQQLDMVGTRYRLVQWGRLPILVRRITADVTLRLAAPGDAILSTLDLRGEPMRRSAVRADAQGRFTLPLDMGAVAGRPTTFFLLERGGGRGVR